MEVTESQERLELQLHLGGCFFQLILDEKLVLIGTKDDGLAEDHLPDFVDDGGNGICIEVHDVLVPARLVYIAVAMDTQVKTLAAKGEALIEGTQQNMPVAAELFHRYSQEAVVTPRVASDDGRVAVRTGLVRQNNLAFQGILEIDEFRLVEFQKSHINEFILASKPWHNGPADTP